MNTNISGTTTLYGVIGDPIAHSLSPKIYNTCFSHFGIDSIYMTFRCSEKEVIDTLNAIKRLNIQGINCTMPCKQPAAKAVDYLHDAAKYIGAVNTIINKDGVLHGYITDGLGVVSDLRDHGIDVKDKNIVQLGVGGAGSAIMVQCALSGAKSIHIFNRNQENLNLAKSVSKQIKEDNNDTIFSFDTFENQDVLQNAVKNADLLINTTPLGMAPNNTDKTPIPKELLHNKLCLYDIVYNPYETLLMKEAKDVGVQKIIGGKGMLMWQAIEAFKLYTGLDMPADILKKALDIA